MRLVSLLVVLAAAAPAAAVQVAPPSLAPSAARSASALVQRLGDESVCGLPSFTRRRACFVRFGDFAAWIYFGPDARTLQSLSLAHDIGKTGVRWVDLDAQGRVTKTLAVHYSDAHGEYSERPLSPAQTDQELADGLLAFAVHGVSEKRERYCSTAGEYEDHMMGCCDGLQEARASNDAYKCVLPGQPVEIEPEYRPWRP